VEFGDKSVDLRLVMLDIFDQLVIMSINSGVLTVFNSLEYLSGLILDGLVAILELL